MNQPNRPAKCEPAGSNHGGRPQRVSANPVQPRMAGHVKLSRDDDRMDLIIYKGSRFRARGVLDVKLHRKATSLGMQLHSQSHHPADTFKGTLNSEARRILINCNNEGDWAAAMSQMATEFSNKGYNGALVNAEFSCLFTFGDRARLLKAEGAKGGPVLALKLPYTCRITQLNVRKIIQRAKRRMRGDFRVSRRLGRTRLVIANKRTFSLRGLADIRPRAPVPLALS